MRRRPTSRSGDEPTTRASRLISHTSRAMQLRGAVRDGHDAIYGKLWRARLPTLPPRDGRSAWRAGVAFVISHAAHSEPAGGAEARRPLQIRTRTPYLFDRRRGYGSLGMLHVVAGADLLALAAARVSTNEFAGPKPRRSPGDPFPPENRFLWRAAFFEFSRNSATRRCCRLVLAATAQSVATLTAARTVRRAPPSGVSALRT